MLDDILVHIQVISREISILFEFFFLLLYSSKWQRSKLLREVTFSGVERLWSRSYIVHTDVETMLVPEQLLKENRFLTIIL